MDFVFPELLDALNDHVYSSSFSMSDFITSLDERKTKMYKHLLEPNLARCQFCNALIQQHAARCKPTILIKSHEQILDYIGKDDIVVNVDYHEDVDYEYEDLFCGNWANNVRNYQWVYKPDPYWLDFKFDSLVLCASPEWTPHYKWLDNEILRNSLANIAKS
jgi:hypothetical protein